MLGGAGSETGIAAGAVQALLVTVETREGGLEAVARGRDGAADRERLNYHCHCHWR